MFFTLNQAAKETGKSKGTISKYIKSGKLSYVSKDETGYKIDPSELFRVFPKQTQETDTNEQLETLEKHIETSSEHKALEREIELLRERLNDKDDVIKDLRNRLDTETEERRKLTLMLTDDRPKSPEKPLEKQKGFFRRLVG